MIGLLELIHVSTTDFQLQFCPNQFRNEFAIWKTVIQLNLIRNVKAILDVVALELESAPPPPSSPPLAGPSRSPRLSAAPSTMPLAGSATPPLTSVEGQTRLGDKHRRLARRLSPLLAIEHTLARKLLAIPEFRGDTEEDEPNMSSLTVRAGSGWKRILEVAVGSPPRGGGGGDGAPPLSNAPDGHPHRRPTTAKASDDPTAALAACCGDILALWDDSDLRACLQARGVRPELGSGFFLDDVERIATPKYEPSADDVLRARIRTVGLEEHHFAVETGQYFWSDVLQNKPYRFSSDLFGS
jgi:guanine nucleotide-binding protein alpha-1 subunit